MLPEERWVGGGPNGRDMGETSDGELVISNGSVEKFLSCVTDGVVVVCAGNEQGPLIRKLLWKPDYWLLNTRSGKKL